MVQQGGYVLLQQVNIGTLLVAAERTCNLGAVRKTLSEIRKALE
jgi:predicted regulator of Ras-like GTPase activity (Roadblock/LC7/MglB family)